MEKNLISMFLDGAGFERKNWPSGWHESIVEQG
jgi:hypothetical protein